jgi:hypothetical protein
MKHSISIVAVAALMFAMASPALAQADFVGGGGDDLWSNAANWSPAGVPTLASGSLNINANARVETAANEIGGVMAINADLIINADLKYPALETNQDVTFQGTITQNAGDVYFSDDMRTFGDAIHTMNGGTFVLRDYYRMDSPSTININGGSFTIGTTGNEKYLRMYGGTVKITGDTATTISFGSLVNFGNTTLDIVFKDGGITTIDVNGGANLPGTLNVTVDSGSFVGDYTLISAGSLSGAIGTVNLPGGDWSVATVGSDVVLTYASGG